MNFVHALNRIKPLLLILQISNVYPNPPLARIPTGVAVDILENSKLIKGIANVSVDLKALRELESHLKHYSNALTKLTRFLNHTRQLLYTGKHFTSSADPLHKFLVQNFSVTKDYLENGKVEHTLEHLKLINTEIK